MALVAYDCSDGSDTEDYDDNPTIATVNVKLEETVKIKPDAAIKNPVLFSSEQSNSGPSLFNLLPQPNQKKPAVIEVDDEFLYKKEVPTPKTKAKITVPLLSDFKDVESTTANIKPKVLSEKKSGLLSILPQPKNAVPLGTTTKSFVPYALMKPAATVKKKELLPNSVKKIKAELKVLKDCSDESDDDEGQTDFFSINRKNDVPIVDVPLDIDVKPSISVNALNFDGPSSSTNQAHSLQSYFKQKPSINYDMDTDEQSSEVSSGQYGAGNSEYYGESTGDTSNANEMVLDEEAIMKLCGSRGKRKKEEIQIVDVNQKEVLGDSREWLLKGLMDDTTKRVSSSKRKGDEPTHQQRRKHQITYLAHQAKANEAELQNQWANNRVSKRQTQSKYGF